MGIILDKSTVKVMAEEKELELTELLQNLPIVSEFMTQKRGSPTLTIHSETEIEEEGEAEEEEEEWDIVRNQISTSFSLSFFSFISKLTHLHSKKKKKKRQMITLEMIPIPLRQSPSQSLFLLLDHRLSMKRSNQSLPTGLVSLLKLRFLGVKT